MTRLEQLAEQWAEGEFGPIIVDGQRNWSRVETQDAHLCGLRAGIELALEAMNAVTCGLTPAQLEGWKAAYTAVEDLKK